jgi:hypothetical protein
MNRLDALAVREVNGKSYFTKLGVAFQNKNGDGWNLLLDAMPAPVDGQFKIMLKPPMQKDGQSSGGFHPRNTPGDDNDIPW